VDCIGYTYMRYVDMGTRLMGIEDIEISRRTDLRMSIRVDGKCGAEMHMQCEADLPLSNELVSQPLMRLFLNDTQLNATMSRTINKVGLSIMGTKTS